MRTNNDFINGIAILRVSTKSKEWKNRLFRTPVISKFENKTTHRYLNTRTVS